MAEKITRRRFLKRMRKHPVVVVFFVIWTLLSALSVLPILLPPEKAQKFTLYPYLPKWDWHIAVIGFLVIGLLMLSESYFDFYRAKVSEIERLESDRQQQTAKADKNERAYLHRAGRIEELENRLRRARAGLEPISVELAAEYEVSDPQTDPIVLVECRWSRRHPSEYKMEERPLTLLNEGGADAKEITIQKVVLQTGQAEFPEVGMLRRKQERQIKGQVFGPTGGAVGLLNVYDLEHLLDSEWNAVSGDYADMPLVILYRNPQGHEFMTKVTLRRFPVRGETETIKYEFLRKVYGRAQAAERF